jgi:mannose-6-phosphate isomerase-like protein (cupin superfamily)
MKLIRSSEAPIFTMGGITVTGLASPKRGAAETCVWRLAVAPSTPGLPHRVTREEIFVGLAGTAVVTIDGVEHALGAGDAIIVPANTLFSLANEATEPFEAMVSLPVGGKAITKEATFIPPWAE